MSTEGAGTACLVIGAPVMLAGSIAAGAGILIHHGVVYVGEKLRALYEENCAKWDAIYAEINARGKANPEAMRGRLADLLEDTATLEAYQEAATSPDNNELRNAVLAAIAEAHAVIEQDSANQGSISEQKLLASRLKAQLAASNTILAPELLQKASTALHGTPQDMRRALHQLEQAWGHVQEKQLKLEYQRKQVVPLLQVITRQLQSIEILSQDMQLKPSLAEQLYAVKQMQEQATALLAASPDKAMQVAQAALDSIRDINSSVSAQVFEIEDDLSRKIYKQQGILASLKTMLDEAHSVELVSTQQESTLVARLAAAATVAETLLQVRGGTGATRRRILLLTERVALLQQDVFALVEQKQQQLVARTIAETLTELGFQMNDAPQENGDIMRVEAVRTSFASSQEGMLQQDDKLIAFDISRSCDVAYDFSGYRGDACLDEAEAVFAALRAKGVFILNQQMVQTLQELPAEHVPSMLRGRDFQILPDKNKLQTALAERLQSVLERMGYERVITRSAGGCIELEAFTGTMGYRVVVTPEGAAEVFKDEEALSLSQHLDDPLVAEAQQVAVEFDYDVAKNRSKPSYSRKQKQRL